VSQPQTTRIKQTNARSLRNRRTTRRGGQHPAALPQIRHQVKPIKTGGQGQRLGGFQAEAPQQRITADAEIDAVDPAAVAHRGQRFEVLDHRRVEVALEQQIAQRRQTAGPQANAETHQDLDHPIPADPGIAVMQRPELAGRPAAQHGITDEHDTAAGQRIDRLGAAQGHPQTLGRPLGSAVDDRRTLLPVVARVELHQARGGMGLARHQGAPTRQQQPGNRALVQPLGLGDQTRRPVEGGQLPPAQHLRAQAAQIAVALDTALQLEPQGAAVQLHPRRQLLKRTHQHQPGITVAAAGCDHGFAAHHQGGRGQQLAGLQPDQVAGAQPGNRQGLPLPIGLQAGDAGLLQRMGDRGLQLAAEAGRAAPAIEQMGAALEAVLDQGGAGLTPPQQARKPQQIQALGRQQAAAQVRPARDEQRSEQQRQQAGAHHQGRQANQQLQAQQGAHHPEPADGAPLQLGWGGRRSLVLVAKLGGIEQFEHGGPVQPAPGIVFDHHRTGPVVDPDRPQPAPVLRLMHQVGEQLRGWLGPLGDQPQTSAHGMHHTPAVAAAGADDTITGPEHGADGLAARPAWPPRAQRHVIDDTEGRHGAPGHCWVALLNDRSHRCRGGQRRFNPDGLRLEPDGDHPGRTG
jgi:hypothetical protein